MQQRTEQEIMENWEGSIDKPVVSICSITYNHEKFIAETLDGFLMQKTCFPFEVLLNEDCSTDNTANIIREYEKKYPNIIKPIYQKENQYSKGLPMNESFNFPRAEGKYIALCEGDDYWADSLKLQKQIDFMQEYNNCSMCFHRAEIKQYNSSLKIEQSYTKDFPGIVFFDSSKPFFEGGSAAPTASMVFRTEIVKKSFPNFYNISPVGDMPLKLLCSLHGKIGYINRIMSVRRLGTPGSWNVRTRLVNKNQNQYLLKMIAMLKCFNEYSNKMWLNDIEGKCVNYAMQVNKLGISDPINIIFEYPTYYKNLFIFQKIKLRIRLVKAYIFRGKINE